jgi:probable rRNA maturation factor
MRSPPELALSIQLGDGSPACPVSRPRLRRWVLAALQHDARLTIRFVGSREGRRLNRDFRGRDYATNVLTFGYEDDGTQGPAKARGRSRSGTAPTRPVVADIVICLPVVDREARAQRKPLEHHLAHLVIHGVLHAQGFEHDDEVEANAMETLETALLRRFRIADPYLPAPSASADRRGARTRAPAR